MIAAALSWALRAVLSKGGLAIAAAVLSIAATQWFEHRGYRRGHADAVAEQAAELAEARRARAKAAEIAAAREAERLAAEAALDDLQREAEDAARADGSGGGLSADRVRRLNAAAGP